MATEFLEAFRMMWEAFPEPAMLIHSNRTVMAANRVARRVGLLPGMKCYGLYPDCRLTGPVAAGEAAPSRQAVVDLAEANGRTLLSYWVPVEGASDLFVHFGIGVLDAVVPVERPEQLAGLRQ